MGWSKILQKVGLVAQQLNQAPNFILFKFQCDIASRNEILKLVLKTN